MTVQAIAGPRQVVLEKIRQRIEVLRDNPVRFGSLTIKLKYRNGVLLEEVEFIISDSC